MHKLSFILKMPENEAVGLAYFRGLLKAKRPWNVFCRLLIRLST